ncbi:MAG TPA: VWA domain-containing protein [Phycisphaerae bacterium]|nr:VWA domain-containing protein [Phycisphaerae bacterium]
MALIHPWLALGVVLGALPMLIHLAARQRYRTVRWAATIWLRQALQEQERHIRRSDRLLLIVRSLILIVAPLILARPVIMTPSSFLKPSAAVLILDVSGSMHTLHGGRTRLAAAKARARELLARLPARSHVGVIGMDDRGLPGTDGLTEDRTRVLAAIDRLDVAGRGSRLQPALTLARQWLGGGGNNNQGTIYLFTDGQEHLFERDAAALRPIVRRMRNTVELVVLPVCEEAAWNISIADLQIERGGTISGRPARIRVRIEADGDRPEELSTGLELWIDGRKADRRTVSLAAGSASAVFAPLVTETGLHTVEARLDPDACELDNRRFAAFFLPSTVGVVVGQDPNSSPGPNDAGTYLRAALQAMAATGPHISVRSIGAPDDWSRALGDDRVWLLILADAGRLPPETAQRIGQFIERGGACWIAGSRQLSETLACLQTGGGPEAAWFDLLRLGRHTADPGNPDRALRIDTAIQASSRPSPAGPEPIGLQQAELRDAFAAVHLFDVCSIEPATDSGWSVALRTSSGRSLLLTHDKAPLAVLTTSLDPSASDWPYRPAFVALVDQLTQWLCRARLVARDVQPGWLWRELPGPIQDNPILVTPSGQRIPIRVPPKTRVGPASSRSDFRVLGCPLGQEAPLSLDTLGVYQLTFPSASSMTAGDARWAVAVNVDPAECRGRIWSPAEIAAWLPGDKNAVIGPGDDLLPKDATDNNWELWPFLAVILLVLLAAETCLGHYFTPDSTVNPTGEVAA